MSGRSRTRVKCSACGRRIPSSEPDITLRRLDSERMRYYHQKQSCMQAALGFVEGHEEPDVWVMTTRSVNAEAN